MRKKEWHATIEWEGKIKVIVLIDPKTGDISIVPENIVQVGHPKLRLITDSQEKST